MVAYYILKINLQNVFVRYIGTLCVLVIILVVVASGDDVSNVCGQCLPHSACCCATQHLLNVHTTPQ